MEILCRDLEVGMEVWACAFAETANKEGKKNYCTPVKGVISSSQYENPDRWSVGYFKYFVPYKKNGKDLAFSKAVRIHSRVYAKTEEECWELYNKLINGLINKYTEKIEELKSYLTV